MSYIYLASPYTNPSPYIRELRFLAVETATVHLLKSGQHVYSPIVHCHALAVKYDLPKEFDFWMAYDKAMIENCRVLYVLGLPGHDTSKGVKHEIEFALSLAKPVSIIDPSSVEAGDVEAILQKLA